ncbi:hypothetical protein [Vibrio intestinalis]|uniref:hypothetical protein n=1 Tax=Vibrio intestinalis TaxID=2933291 RepID=UPI0021A5BBBE|nr:hypothetical protein [Vibrio intestinalis]
MKNAFIIALSLFSLSAFASDTAQSNNGLNGDLIQQATAAGMTTEQAVKGVSVGEIQQGPVLDRKEHRRGAEH